MAGWSIRLQEIVRPIQYCRRQLQTTVVRARMRAQEWKQDKGGGAMLVEFKVWGSDEWYGKAVPMLEEAGLWRSTTSSGPIRTQTGN